MQIHASNAKHLKTQNYFTKSHVYQMRIATFYVDPTQKCLNSSLPLILLARGTDET